MLYVVFFPVIWAFRLPVEDLCYAGNALSEMLV